jgi:hypothetical protein
MVRMSCRKEKHEGGLGHVRIRKILTTRGYPKKKIETRADGEKEQCANERMG